MFPKNTVKNKTETNLFKRLFQMYFQQTITVAGYKPYVTEFLFDDDERLIGKIREQSVQNRFHIAKPEKVTGPFDQQFSYSMLLDKE